MIKSGMNHHIGISYAAYAILNHHQNKAKLALYLRYICLYSFEYFWRQLRRNKRCFWIFSIIVHGDGPKTSPILCTLTCDTCDTELRFIIPLRLVEN